MVVDISAKIAGVAISQAISKDEFSIIEMKSNLDCVDECRIFEVLDQLEQDDWMKKSKSSPIERWSAGPLALKYGDMVSHVGL